MDDTSAPGPPAEQAHGLPMDAHRRSSLFPPEVIAQIQRTAAEATTRFAAGAPSGPCPRSTTCCS